MVWKNLIKKLSVWLVIKGLNHLFDLIDKDNNGEISKAEIQAFIKNVRNRLNNINRKLK